MKIVNIIGAGLIGQERLKAVAKLQARGLAVQIGWVHDPYQPRLGEFATTHRFQIENDLGEFLKRPCDLVIVACPHNIATDLTCQALRAGHRVLLEKPIGRNLSETSAIVEAAQKSPGLFVGLNYRFMPGVAALINDWKTQRFGTPISLRLQIGHGGKPGDEKTWKLDPIQCGGGALLDPGIHLIDLATVLLGNTPSIVAATSWSGFWKTGIEEDVHLLMQHDKVNISIDVSITTWRSSFEIFALGSDGYGCVTGRGRSYGRQYYRRGVRWGWQQGKDQALTEDHVIDDPCEDSFADELASCLGLATTPGITPANLGEGLVIMKLYQDLKARLGSV